MKIHHVFRLQNILNKFIKKIYRPEVLITIASKNKLEAVREIIESIELSDHLTFMISYPGFVSLTKVDYIVSIDQFDFTDQFIMNWYFDDVLSRLKPQNRNDHYSVYIDP